MGPAGLPWGFGRGFGAGGGGRSPSSSVISWTTTTFFDLVGGGAVDCLGALEADALDFPLINPLEVELEDPPAFLVWTATSLGRGGEPRSCREASESTEGVAGRAE